MDAFNSVATSIAASPELLFKALEDYSDFLLSQQVVNIPKTDIWLGFYRNNRAINKKMLELVLGSIDNGNIPLKNAAIHLKALFKNFNIPTHKVIEKINFLSKNEKAQLILRFENLDLRNDYQNINSMPVLPLPKDELLKIPELSTVV